MSNDVLNTPGPVVFNDSGNSDKRECGCMERVGNASPLSVRLDRVPRDWTEHRGACFCCAVVPN